MATIDTSNTAASGVVGSSNAVSDSLNNVLDKDAFLRLFLEELKMQDPTAPMDSEKILEQTALLTNMETQQLLKKFVEDLSSTMTQNAALQLQYAAVGMVGKKVDTDLDSISVESVDRNVDFKLYFDKVIKSGELKIETEAGETIKTISLLNKAGEEGYVDFSWDLTDATGAIVSPGVYKISATYFDENGQKYETRLGRGRVESVLFDKGTAYLKLGDSYFPTTNVAEYYE